LSQKIEININAIDNASSKISSMANNIDRSLDNVNRSSNEVVRNQHDLERAVTSTADNSSREVADASQEIDRNYDGVNRSSDEVVSNQRDLERAVDDVSRNATGDVDSAANEITKDYADVGRAADDVKAKHASMGEGMKGVVTGFSGVATAGYSLYNAYDRVQDMTLQVDKANLAAEKSANALEDVTRRQTEAGTALTTAQDALNVAIEKYGVDSTEATEAQENLKKKTEEYNAVSADASLAQETYNLKVENAKQTQDNFNQAIIQSGIQMGVTTISLVDNIGKVWKNLDSLGGEDGIIKMVSSKLAGLKDIDFTQFLEHLGLVDTSIKGIATTAATAAASFASIAAVMYVGWSTSQQKTYNALIPPGVPQPSLSPGQTSTPFGIPTLGLNPGNFIGIPRQHGGWVGLSGPETVLAGEAGSEYVIPHHELGGLGGVVNHVNVSINVEGSVDERVLRLMKQRLKTVIVEATSSAAPSTQRRIRLGSVFT
jgi:hypothetical protein